MNLKPFKKKKSHDNKKKEEMSYHVTKLLEETLKPPWLGKEASLKGYVLYDSNCMTSWNRQNFRGQQTY